MTRRVSHLVAGLRKDSPSQVLILTALLWLSASSAAAIAARGARRESSA